VAPLLKCDGMGLVTDNFVYLARKYYRNTHRCHERFAKYSREDLAAAFQQRLEEVLVEMVKNSCEHTGKRNIALAGGVFANVKLNQRINELPMVDRVFVHPGMGDFGLALGSAFAAMAAEYKRQGRDLAPVRIENVFFGPSYTSESCRRALDESGLAGCQQYDDIEAEVAQRLADGKIVARYRGRMEYGPRALGNRSILYHTRDKTVNDWLNKKLARTEFMPFAPAVLEGFEEKCLKYTPGSDYTSEFMTITYDCTDYAKQACGAAVHIDGTARPQIVKERGNPTFAKLLARYNELTGCPVVINTSFNIHEEPIVCAPEDAIKAFKQSKLDYLALEDYLVDGEKNFGAEDLKHG